MKKDKNFKRYISAGLVLGLILPLSLPELEKSGLSKVGLNSSAVKLQADEEKSSAENSSENADAKADAKTDDKTDDKSEDKNQTASENKTDGNTAGDGKEESGTAGGGGATDGTAEVTSDELEAPENDNAVISKSESLGEMSLEEAGKGMELIAENDAAALFYSSETSLVRLYNKNKKLVFDNKVLEGQKGNRLTKNLQKSDFQLTFLKELRTLGVQSENNNEMSIELKQFDFAKIENGLKVTFTLGKQGLSADDMPVAIPSEKMAKILKKLKKTERKQLLRLYREFKDRYARKNDQTMSALQLKLYHGLLYDKGGYTKEDLEEDNAKYSGGEEAKSSSLKIELTMEYLLDGEDLLVKVPLSEIKINPDNYLPYRLRLLPYAMIGSEVDDGYFVVPDGNGAIVKFNNDRKESANYSKRMYGEDVLFDKDKKREEKELKLPVFGMRRDKQGVLLILEDGKDLADVTVEISGKSDEFNKLGIDYRLIDVDQVKTVGSSSVTQNKYPERLYTGDIVQRYRILDDKEADWLQMARIYAGYLENKGALPKLSHDTAGEKSEVLSEDKATEENSEDKKEASDAGTNESVDESTKKLSESSQINTNLSFFGIVPKKKFFLGVPYMSNQVMTSYLEAGEILRDLANAMKQNKELESENTRLSVSYLAESDNGLFPDGKNENLLSGKLGSVGQRTELKDLIGQLGGDLTTVLTATEVASLKGFNKPAEISRSLSGEYARENVYNSVQQSSRYRHDSPWFISPRFLPVYVSELINRLGDAAGTSLSLEGLGESLVPDYKRGETVLRHEAMEVEHDLIEKIADEHSDKKIALNDPADYALVSAENINIKNIVCEADPYRVFNYYVPFVSSIYRDRFDMELESFEPNSFMSLKKYLLHSLETGAVPNFLLTYKNALTLENGDYEGLLGSEYSLRKDDILTSIKVRNDYLNNVGDASLVDEKIYANGILRSLEFSNGKILWLNFSERELSLADKILEAEGYLFVDKKDSEKIFTAAEKLEKKHLEEEEEKDKAEKEAKEAGEDSASAADKESKEDKEDKKVSETSVNSSSENGKEKSESASDSETKKTVKEESKDGGVSKSEDKTSDKSKEKETTEVSGKPKTDSRTKSGTETQRVPMIKAERM